MQASVGQVLDFLTMLYARLGYSAMNTARSALSSFVILPGGHTLGSHTFIARFMKGVFNLKTPKPHYDVVWDVKLVLDYLRQLLHTPNVLGLRDLTKATCMLIALVSAQRQQTLHKLNIENMTIKPNAIAFYVQLVKQSKPGNAGIKVELLAYDQDKRICEYRHLLEYLKRTQSLRGNEKQLFVSYKKPYRKVSKDTLGRWIKQVMAAAGVDTSQFKPHSTRTCKARAALLPVTEIMQKAGS